MSEEWAQRLEDMAQIRDLLVSKLGAGGSCSEAWHESEALSAELGYGDHLMGMPPNQARFLRSFRRIGVRRVACRCKRF